jgi:anti-sigma regulatory factor (Ser/Thr protein kinase)
MESDSDTAADWRFPASPQGLAKALDALGERLWALGLRPDVVRRLSIAVDELMGNLLRHDPPATSGVTVRLQVFHRAGTVEVVLHQPGRPFDPTRVGSPEAPQEIGGVGLRITNSIVDGMQYRRVRDTNVVHLSVLTDL